MDHLPESDFDHYSLGVGGSKPEKNRELNHSGLQGDSSTNFLVTASNQVLKPLLICISGLVVIGTWL